jgi:predicted dehydrogenase
MAEPRIRLGMVGGGEGAFIGRRPPYRRAPGRSLRTRRWRAFGLPDKAIRSAAAIGLGSDRSYPDFRTMAQAEAARTDGIEAVAIVTPNHMHAPVADAFLDAGVHIICDKPLTTTLEEARRLRDKARSSGLIFAVTYNYSGYPLVRHARSMVQGGELGAIRIVQVEYPQDWLADPLEATGQKQADRARLHPETITRCGYGCSVRRAVWIGDRKNRTFWSGRRSVKHHGWSAAARRP